MSSVLSITTKVTAGCPIDEATAEACALATKLGIWVHFEFNGVDCNAAPHSDPKELGISQQRSQDSNTRYPMAYAHTQEPNPGVPFPYPTDRDGWICSVCHGWNMPKDRVCMHSHLPPALNRGTVK